MSLDVVPKTAPHVPSPGKFGRGLSRNAVIAIVVAVALILGAVYWLTRGSGGGNSPAAPATGARSSTAASDPLAAEVVRIRAAAAAQRNVHVVLAARFHHIHPTIHTTQDSQQRSGIQRIRIHNARSVVRVVGADTYFVANRPGMQTLYSFKPSRAATFAGRWFHLTSGQRGYAGVSEAVTIPSLVNQISLQGPISRLPARIKAGRKVVGLVGMSGGTEPPNTPVKLWIAASGKPLPVEYNVYGAGGKEIVIFRHWNHDRVRVHRPSNA